MAEICISNAAPEYAEALAQAVRAYGGRATIADSPARAGICLLTEALATERSLSKRHAAALAAMLARSGCNAPTFVLDFGAAGHLSDIGGCAGLCRSLRAERPEDQVYALSLEAQADPADLALRVVSALARPPGDWALSSDGGWRDTPGAELAPPATPSSLPPDPVWLVTGGARGVTADCAAELARRTGGTFLLLGRSERLSWPDWLPPEHDLKTLRGLLARQTDRPGMPKKPAEINQFARQLLAGAEISASLQAIAEAGARPLYVRADIANAAETRRILSDIQQTEGQITGIVHGAGVLSDGMAETLHAEQFEKVFAPKVEGLRTLLSCIAPETLSHIGLFSSASAVFGNTGQANYAAANAWLNNVAEQLAQTLPRTQVKAFCWGPWQGGMVDETLARMFTERGIGLIARPEGARIFADMLLNSPKGEVRFVVGDAWGPA